MSVGNAEVEDRSDIVSLHGKASVPESVPGWSSVV